MKRRMTKDGVVRAAVQGLPRRDFIKGSALVAGMGVWVASGGRVLGVPDKPLSEQSPSDRINVASIGIGGKGDSDSDQAGKHANLVAICDIDEKRLDAKAMRFPKAKKYTDFRKMFDEMHKDIDACTISTPDHTHAVATMMAIKLGKHVYTQKPLAHDVWEARQLRLAVNEHKVASQMGNQGTRSTKFREGVDTIRAGVIGAVKEVHVWTNRPIWPQAPGVVDALPEEPVPTTIHWEEWLGTAPERKYNKGYHPFKWRGWWDFGTGALGDMGCHTANLAFMALKLQSPISIEGECGDLNPQTYPSWAQVVFQFPEREGMPPVKFTWYEGKKDGVLVHPPKELADKVVEEYAKAHAAAKDDGKSKKKKAPTNGLSNSGCIVVGEKGMLYSPDDYGASWALLPHEAFADQKEVTPVLSRHEGEDGGDEGQKIEWLAAARGGAPALSNFNYAGYLAEFILLGNIAIKNPGRKLEFDGPNLKFPNYPEADRLLKREYRAPWAI